MIDRRNALKMLGGAALGTALGARLDAARTDIPIIDAHIHLFDTGRPGGVPWPEKSDTAIYKPALPDRYARLAKPHGVVGAIVVEASPLDRDNEWVLHEAAEYPIIVGFVGDLIPGTSSYPRRLDQLRSNPVFVGIRYGNLWNRELGADLKKPGFVDDLKRLSSHGLELDAANPDPELIRAVVRVSEEVPDLRIVIDHLPNAALPDAVEQQQEYWTNLKTLSQNPRVFIKLSEIPARVNGRIPTNISYYRDNLDRIWDLFGEDHILFGSDWPNSDHLLNYGATFSLVHSYVAEKGRAAEEKFFWKNSLAAYRWHRRMPDQPAL